MAVALLENLIAYWNMDEIGVAVARVDAHTGGHDLLPIG